MAAVHTVPLKESNASLKRKVFFSEPDRPIDHILLREMAKITGATEWLDTVGAVSGESSDEEGMPPLE